MATDICYTIIHQEETLDATPIQEFKKSLETGLDDSKIETMKKILTVMLNGDPCPGLLMHVIRFVMPSKNKQLKRLLHFYWEVCPKLNPDGKLKQEMILVCNAIRNDLQHPNEYICGATLRFLSKLHEAELLEPLIPTVRTCLEHRHSYVRKNAVLAIYAIHKNFEHLLPDAPEIVYSFLLAESDVTCKRNAFVMLCNCNRKQAVEFLHQVFDQVVGLDELLQFSIIEFIRKDSKSNPPEKGRYMKCILALLEAPSVSVRYEASSTLMTLTSAPSLVKAAASCYIELILKEPDNNVKLIVLDKIDELRKAHEGVLDDLVMDLLRLINSPDFDVRKKCLSTAMEMVSSRNVAEIVSFLKKELSKASTTNYEKNAEFQQLLIKSIHSCAVKYSEVAAEVIYELMEYLGDPQGSSGVDVISFVREAIQKYPELRQKIVAKLLDTFADVKTGKVFRGVIWILGEFALEQQEMLSAIERIRDSVGEVPILGAEERARNEKEDESTENKENATATVNKVTSPRVLADGTYATESAFTNREKAKSAELCSQKTPLRGLILGGDFIVGAILASSYVKLLLRLHPKLESSKYNALQAECMLVMISIVRVGRSEFVAHPIDDGTVERIISCVRFLSTNKAEGTMGDIFAQDTKNALHQFIKNAEKARKEQKNNTGYNVQPDDLITFGLLKSKKAANDQKDEYEMDISRATGVLEKKGPTKSLLSRVMQLTGFSDPVYAEAYVLVNRYLIQLDILIVNQTSDTLQNLSIEFATFGDLKLVEKPSQYNLGPHSFLSIKASLKVSSTETGIIFGNIVFDSHGSTENTVIVMNDIHLDVIDYINPDIIAETTFRSLWTEFEWENKINVNTNITDLRTYLDHLTKSTNMKLLTPEHSLHSECGFLSANLYAKSIFGEDALANVCLEKLSAGPVTGHIRIRSRTQGIALSLGDKITLTQKLPLPA